MSIRKLLAESRKSGNAVEYVTNPDGSRTITQVIPPRGVYTPAKLRPEERLFILMETGHWPEDLPAEAWCGVQENDNRGYDRSPMSAALKDTGIMSGYVDPTGQRGRHADSTIRADKTGA